MPQLQLPLIPSGTKSINNIWSVDNSGSDWTYFCGIVPVFSHAAGSLQSFCMFTAQLVCQGGCTQAEIQRAFGVSKSSVRRSVKKYRAEGAEAFFRPRKGRGASVITEEVKDRVEELFATGKTKKEVAEELGVKYDTLRKAVLQGRVGKPLRIEKVETEVAASDKSTRSFEDAEAERGRGAANQKPASGEFGLARILGHGAPPRSGLRLPSSMAPIGPSVQSWACHPIDIDPALV